MARQCHGCDHARGRADQRGEITGEGNGDRGDRPGRHDEQQGPAVQESGQRTEGIAQVGVAAPARGWRAPSSAKQNAPASAMAPPITHAPRATAALGVRSATTAGLMKMPAPMMPPITIMVPSKVRMRRA